MESACILFGPFRNVEIEEADGSSSGQEEYNLVGLWPRSGGGALHFGHSDLGRRGEDWQMAQRTKRILVQSGSKSSDVETSEKTCRSGDVRDP